jgi:hypothetical protein
MRRARKSTYEFDAAKLRGKMREVDVVRVDSYLAGKTVPSSEVLIDLMDILMVDVSALVKAAFSLRSDSE